MSTVLHEILRLQQELEFMRTKSDGNEVTVFENNDKKIHLNRILSEPVVPVISTFLMIISAVLWRQRWRTLGLHRNDEVMCCQDVSRKIALSQHILEKLFLI